jgi:hypothetical protein
LPTLKAVIANSFVSLQYRFLPEFNSPNQCQFFFKYAIVRDLILTELTDSKETLSDQYYYVRFFLEEKRTKKFKSK